MLDPTSCVSSSTLVLWIYHDMSTILEANGTFPRRPHKHQMNQVLGWHNEKTKRNQHIPKQYIETTRLVLVNGPDMVLCH